MFPCKTYSSKGRTVLKAMKVLAGVRSLPLNQNMHIPVTDDVIQAFQMYILRSIFVFLSYSNLSGLGRRYRQVY
jgi:hypothetical protein